MTPGLFSWQRAVLASCLPLPVQLTGLRVALDSQQVTGEGVVVNADAVADDLGCSTRTVWRHVGVLTEAEWMIQTSKPTYGGKKSGGRRARYRLVIPSKSCDTPRCGKSHDPIESCAISPLDVAGDNTSRVPNRPESCATTTPDVGTLSTSVGTTTAAAAAVSPDQLPGPVAILASKMSQHTPLRGLRWDISPDKIARIADCLDKVGDTVLVDYAITTLRHPVPTYATAFLEGWEVRANATSHLSLVKTQRFCTENRDHATTQLTAAGICRSCAAEAIAR